MEKDGLKRYDFDLTNRTPQFLRSFAIFEDLKQNLYVSSFQGNVFKLNTETDQFEKYPITFPSEVEFATVLGGSLIVGAFGGVFRAEMLPDGGFGNLSQKLKSPFVSFVSPVFSNRYFVATRGDAQFMVDSGFVTPTDIGKRINNVNHVYHSGEKDIWISSNDGLFRMNENLFSTADEEVTAFIECIAEDKESGTIYYASNQKMYSYDPSTDQNEELLEIPGGYFQSMVHTQDGLWIANSFNVFLYANGQIRKEFDFSSNAMFATGLDVDPSGNVWFAIPGGELVYRIDRSHQLSSYRVPLASSGLLGRIHTDSSGIYIGSSGKNSYLFFKNYSDSIFRNISLDIPFLTQNEFTVSNLTSRKGVVWLASSEGLLTYDYEKVQRIDLGDYTVLPHKSISLYRDHFILTANANGLILYDINTGFYDLFNESSGMVSRTIVSQGTLVDSDQDVWVCTSRGLCFSNRSLVDQQKTLKPKFTRLTVNGTKSKLDGEKIGYGSYVSIWVSSITFPENEVGIQYRILPDERWQTSRGPEISFTALTTGDHSLEVVAKKNGPYAWSDVSSMNFSIQSPFWRRSWFYVLCLVAVAFVIAITLISIETQSQKRNKKLQLLISERTKELEQRNQELIDLNQEKNNLVSLVAHDLKNPLGQMIGFLSVMKRDENSVETPRYLEYVESSAIRLNNLITKILDLDAIESSRLNLEINKVNVSEILNTVADHFTPEADKKLIRINRDIEPDCYAMVDRSFIEEVFENLLSNSIKFSPFEKTVFVALKHKSEKVICQFRDEGPGIDASDQKKLFGKYQRLSAKPTGNEISTGLGLSVVKKLVLAMNGEVWCESASAKGAIFFVAFPKV